MLICWIKEKLNKLEIRQYTAYISTLVRATNFYFASCNPAFFTTLSQKENDEFSLVNELKVRK